MHKLQVDSYKSRVKELESKTRIQEREIFLYRKKLIALGDDPNKVVCERTKTTTPSS